MSEISQISYYYSFRFLNHCNHYTCFQILCNQQASRKNVKKKKKHIGTNFNTYFTYFFFFLRQNLSSAYLEKFNLIILIVVVTILYSRSSDFMHLITESICSPSSPYFPYPQTLETTILLFLCVWTLIFRSHIKVISCSICLFVLLISFSIMLLDLSTLS